ncbi:MAG: hypothetical protein VR73_14780 [Gammaproteobacteria bacterium BRH_c0]|nr:MAG: hypothetical protein VR73_14780 [Gammaproteobacteria bacterium BRH_c0]
MVACIPSTTAPGDKDMPLISGLELSGMDTSVRPQDDLFVYANGNWLRETETPPDKASWGTFDILRERTLEQLRTIVETSLDNPQTHHEQLTAYLYRDLLNSNNEKRGDLRMLADELAAIAKVDSHDKLPALFARLSRIGVTTPLGAWIAQDRRNSSQYVVYLSQGGLGLPDRDYYFDDSEQGKVLLAGYDQYLQQLLKLASDRDKTKSRSAKVIALEKSLAEHHWTRVANRDAEKTYNPASPEDVLSELSPRWRGFFADQGIDGQPLYVVLQPSYLEEVNDLVDATDLRIWRDYLKLQLLSAYAPHLGSDFDQAQFNFFGKQLRGTPEQEPQWQRAINFMNGSIGEVLGQLYVKQHFPPQAKKQMLELVGNVKAAFHGSISELAWMTPATRARALEKLAAFNTKIGYPDKWRDFSALEIRPNDLIGNIQRIRQWQHQRDVERLGQPVDRDEWYMPPQTVNAYYSPSMNEIVFPAAILQPPFFNRDAEDAVNYGAIGAVIGHEIGHGFDDQGSRFDGSGNLSNWWSDEDRQHFEALGKKLVAQYNQYEPLPGEPMNGELTLGENIGDLGGLSMALRAYELSLDGREPPVIDGFTGYQRVFLGWAQAWRLKRRDELVRQLLKTGPHSQAEFRVNGVVVNIDSFHQAFNTQPGDDLYKPPEKRIKIW